MQSAEIEIKFRVADPTTLQASLPDLGFHLVTPRTFESNTLYDSADRTLLQSGQILRLRKYGGVWTLTHKRHPDDEDPDALYKVRIETETTVADGEALAEVFLRLGYGPVFKYEKYRSEWAREGGHLVIDETPIGNFCELEGPVEWIDAARVQLGVEQVDCTTESYGKLFLAWKESTGSDADNLTFDEIPSMALQRS